MTRVRRIDPVGNMSASDRALASGLGIGWVSGYSTNEATSSSDFRLRSGTTQSSAG